MQRQSKDGKVMLVAWLGFGAERVTKLDREIMEGHHKKLSITEARGAKRKAALADFRRPILFDFARTKNDAAIVR